LAANVAVTAKTTVKDERSRPLSQAMVVGIWTQPDGTQMYHYAQTNRLGIATFGTTGPRAGTYKFEVVNIVLSLYTFNPSKSVLSQSITVR
jgi:hypothetical protein